MHVESIVADSSAQTFRTGSLNHAGATLSPPEKIDGDNREARPGVIEHKPDDLLSGSSAIGALSRSTGEARAPNAATPKAASGDSSLEIKPSGSSERDSNALKGLQLNASEHEQGAQKTPHPKAAWEVAEERRFTGGAVEDSRGATLIHDMAGTREQNWVQAGSGEPSHLAARGAASNMTSQETFAALDREASPGTIQWVHAGARHAEAGYLDPALGWVSVRAEASAGGIHAAVLPGSSEAAQALGSHMTALSAFLSEHHGASATVTLATPGSDGFGAATDQSNSAGDGNGRDNRPESNGGRADVESDGARRAPSSTADLGDADITAVGLGSAGETHVSLMA